MCMRNKLLKSVFYVFCMASILSLGIHQPASYAADGEGFFDAHVVRVSDANTFILRGGTIVQFMGIDTPVLRGGNPLFLDIAQEAMTYNKKLLEGKKVRLEFVEPAAKESADSRKFAYVFIGGRMINALLLQKGYAAVSSTFPPDDKYSDYFAQIQSESASAHRGLWKKFKQSTGVNQYAFK